MEASRKYFITKLSNWHTRANKRSLPWKYEKDPYRIWLSEILLQQTKAEQAIPYYLTFLKKYPSIKDLALASDKEVFSLWQGLGYYNRCKNLLHTARQIYTERNGIFPDTFTEILALKGIGPYTASAIASFAFKLPHAVVDGNVYRILSRYFGLEIGFFNAADKKFYHTLAQNLLPQDSASFNQAIMDFGASICKPSNALCNTCPLQQKCEAFLQHKVAVLPLKKPKLSIKERHFHYIVISQQNKVYIRKRTGKDIWQNLHEFYLIESKDARISIPDSILSLLSSPQIYQQKLTHQKIHSYFYQLKKWPKDLEEKEEFVPVPFAELRKYAMPKSLVSYCEDNLV